MRRPYRSVWQSTPSMRRLPPHGLGGYSEEARTRPNDNWRCHRERSTIGGDRDSGATCRARVRRIHDAAQRAQRVCRRRLRLSGRGARSAGLLAADGRANRRVGAGTRRGAVSRAHPRRTSEHRSCRRQQKRRRALRSSIARGVRRVGDPARAHRFGRGRRGRGDFVERRARCALRDRQRSAVVCGISRTPRLVCRRRAR